MAVKVEALIAAVWTDITAYVMYDGKVTITQGVPDRSARPVPDSAQFVLNNRDYRFSGNKPGALYYKTFVKGIHVRITETTDADPEQFYGEIALTTLAADSTDTDVRLAVTAMGILRRLQDAKKPLRSALARSVLALSPLVMWSLSDGSNAADLANSIPGAVSMRYNSSVTLGDADCPLGETACIRMDVTANTTAGRAYASLPQRVGTSAWELGFWFKVEPNDTFAIVDLIEIKTSSTQAKTLVIGALHNPDVVVVNVFDADGAIVAALAPEVDDYNVLDGEWHFIHLLGEFGSGDFNMYLTLDGNVNLQSLDFAAITYGIPTEISLPRTSPTMLGIDSISYSTVWVVDDYAGYTNIFEAGYGHRNDTPCQRFIRLCTEEGISYQVVGNQVDNMTMGVQRPLRIGDLLSEVLAVGQGAMYGDSGSLDLVYRTRLSSYNQPVPIATFDYSAGHLSSEFKPLDDDFGLVNDMQIDRPDGGSGRIVIQDHDPYHFTTEDAPDGIGTKDGGDNVAIGSEDMAKLLAGWRAHQGAWKEPRYPLVQVHIKRGVFTASSSLTAQAVAVRLGDRIRVNNPPAWQEPGPRDLLVRGRIQVIDQFERLITWNTVPYLTEEVWQLNGRDSTAVIAANSSATSLLVDMGLGPEWDESAEPYYWDINGEIVRVTAIAKATPTYIATCVVSSASNANVTPALPAGITVDIGQTLWMWATIRNSGTGTVNTPSGWTTIADFGNTRLMARYYRTGVTGPTVTFNGGVANATTQAQIWAMSGLSLKLGSGTKKTPAAITQLNGSAQDIAFPRMVIYRLGGAKFVLVWKQDDGTSIATPSFADGELFDSPSALGDDSFIAGWYDISTADSNLSASSAVVTGGASAISRAVAFSVRPLQQATIVRSINGVSQSIAADAAINSYRPGALSL